MRVKSEEKRQAILDIAKSSFTQNGFEQTSMSAIAKQLGGSKATLYNYFSSKEEIFAAVMESSATEGIAAAFENLSGRTEIHEALTKFGNTYLSSILAPSLAAIKKMAIAEADRSDIGRQFYINGPKRGYQKVADFLHIRMSNGELRTSDPFIAAIQLKSLLEAELYEPFILGVISTPNQSMINDAVERALSAFFAIYEIKR
jgi:AcrR family transcriptional regulator